MRRLTDLVIVAMLAAVLGAGLTVLALSRLIKEQGAQNTAVVERVEQSVVDQAKLRMCIETLDRSCTIQQWGKPCVLKKPGRSPFE